MNRYFHWWSALFIAFAAALFFRAGLPFPFVFTIDGVTLQENDAWYHMRLIEGFLSGIPAFTLTDPHASFPGPQRVDVGPLLNLLVIGKQFSEADRLGDYIKHPPARIKGCVRVLKNHLHTGLNIRAAGTLGRRADFYALKFY